MRGNEPGYKGTFLTAEEITIPMRGNEERALNEWVNDIREITIPMRGNEAMNQNAKLRVLRDYDPHEG